MSTPPTSYDPAPGRATCVGSSPDSAQCASHACSVSLSISSTSACNSSSGMPKPTKMPSMVMAANSNVSAFSGYLSMPASAIKNIAAAAEANSLARCLTSHSPSIAIRAFTSCSVTDFILSRKAGHCRHQRRQWRQGVYSSSSGHSSSSAGACLARLLLVAVAAARRVRTGLCFVIFG